MKKQAIATLILTTTALGITAGAAFTARHDAAITAVLSDTGRTETTPHADATGVIVDIYQNMESGNDGQLLSAGIMNAASHGGLGVTPATWDFKYGDQMWVSTDHARDLPGLVTVGETNYSGSSARSWRFRNREELQCVKVRFGTNQWDAPDHDRITIAAYYTTYQTDDFSNQHDTIEVGGIQSFGVLQTIGNVGDDPPYIRAHSSAEGWVTTFSPQIIKIEPGKTYWVNLHYDGPAGEVKVAAFDPDNNWQQVGETAVAQSVPGSAVRSYAHFGRCSAHGNWPNNDSSAYFDHILIDFSNAAFPLLPNLEDLVLHGTPADEAIRLNWTVNVTLPVTSSWQIDYYTQTASIYTANNALSTTRSAGLTDNVVNYQWYTVTLHSMLGETAWLSDTVRVMPTEKFTFLPLARKD